MVFGIGGRRSEAHAEEGKKARGNRQAVAMAERLLVYRNSAAGPGPPLVEPFNTRVRGEEKREKT